MEIVNQVLIRIEGSLRSNARVSIAGKPARRGGRRRIRRGLKVVGVTSR